MPVFLPFLSLTSFFFLLSSLFIWKWKSLSHVWLFATSWAIQSMEFSRPELLVWVVVPFSRESSKPRDWTQVSRIAGGFFTSWATGKPKNTGVGSLIPSPGDLSDPGVQPGSPALQVNSQPTELSGNVTEWTLKTRSNSKHLQGSLSHQPWSMSGTQCFQVG